VHSNPTVLIVDDNPASIDFMVELLKKYDVSAVTSVREAREAMANETPDLILLDISMPEVDGFEFCSELKTDPKKQNIPVIFLTASNSNEDIHHALSIGGADYITKPYQAEVVSKRIETQLELVDLRKKLRKAELMDGLSGTKKKEVFNVEAKRWCTYAQTEDRVVTMCAIGIDNLKEINLKYGMDTADEVIKAIALYLSSLAKKHMLVARMGGGLFVLLVYGVNASQFAPSLETIQKAIEKIRMASLPDLKVEVSTGISDSVESAGYDTLLNNALRHNSENSRRRCPEA